MDKKILFITAQIPWGKGESFILGEMLEIKRQGINLLIIPRNPFREVFHKDAKELLENALWLPLLNFKILKNFLGKLFTKLELWKILGTFFKYSRNPWILIKNLAVFPKAIFITKILPKEKINYIHAHWGGTTATMAYIVSRFTKIPYSFTLHRWDIKENNMLREKVRSAKFVRCISECGKNELIEIIGEKYKEKIKVIYMGIKIPLTSKEILQEKKSFKLITPANLVEVKGHKYLIEACTILVEKDIKNFQCIFYGEGRLRTKLESLIKEKKLSNYVKMPGAIPHEKLMEIYKNKEIGTVILPSIVTNKGEHEGIPVALMEAMAYRTPVISTNTGGIPELLSNGTGVIIKEKSPEQLVEAILKIMKDENFKKEISEKGYQRVRREFNVEQNAKTLIESILK